MVSEFFVASQNVKINARTVNGMKNFLPTMKLSELLFLATGILLLASLPWLKSGEVSLWLFAKVFYFAGVAFFLIKR